jgi:alpha-mannosidase
VRVNESNVHLAALKQGENGGMALRLVEVQGVETRANVELSLHLVPGPVQIRSTDTLERPDQAAQADLRGRTLVVDLPAHGIVTVLVVPA